MSALRRRTHDDLADIDIGWLIDRERDRACDRVGWNRDSAGLGLDPVRARRARDGGGEVGRDRADAGVVDQDIESTVGREGEGDERVNLATLADVTRCVDRLAACVLDAARELREPIFAACTEDEGGAGGSKAKRGGFADATTRPGGSEPAQPTLQAHRRRHPGKYQRGRVRRTWFVARS